MAYEEFGKILKRLMEGEAIVYISDFINSSMIKYDKVKTKWCRTSLCGLYKKVQSI